MTTLSRSGGTQLRISRHLFAFSNSTSNSSARWSSCIFIGLFSSKMAFSSPPSRSSSECILFAGIFDDQILSDLMPMLSQQTAKSIRHQGHPGQLLSHRKCDRLTRKPHVSEVEVLLPCDFSLLNIFTNLFLLILLERFKLLHFRTDLLDLKKLRAELGIELVSDLLSSFKRHLVRSRCAFGGEQSNN